MAEDDFDAPVDPTTPTRRIMIMISVVLGSTLYSTTLLIASTLLPQMQGAMSATQDEIAWAMTYNILATAVVTPMTGWLVARFGRRGVMVGSMALFSLFTYLCGAADSLETLVLWRILQGAAGAPVTPLSQPVGGDLLRAAGAVARPASRLVRVTGDLAGDHRGRHRPLPFRGAQPDGRAAVPEPTPLIRPQLRAGSRAGRGLRYAERYAD